MATENLENLNDEELEDENLDALLEQPAQETPPAPPSETKDTPAPSTDPEEEDPADDEVVVPDDSTDPKDIAIRNLRNANKRLHKKLKRDTPDVPPSPEPETKPKAGSPLYNRYINNEFKTNVMFAQQTDDTIVQRVPMIKKIMFQEMPELLEKPNGFEIANDLAKGRTITVAPSEKAKGLAPQTPTPRPAGATPKQKVVTQKEYDQMSEAERTAYENSQIGA